MFYNLFRFKTFVEERKYRLFLLYPNVSCVFLIFSPVENFGRVPKGVSLDVPENLCAHSRPNASHPGGSTYSANAIRPNLAVPAGLQVSGSGERVYETRTSSRIHGHWCRFGKSSDRLIRGFALNTRFSVTNVFAFA